MKKLLLSLGTLAAIAAPVATVVACGSSHSNGGAKGKPDKTGGPSITPAQAAINAAAHAAEVAATSKNGTKANNVDGEDLTRPFNDIADTQDDNTVYQSGKMSTKTLDGSIKINGDTFDLHDLNLDTKDIDFNNFNSISFTMKNDNYDKSASYYWTNTFSFNALDSSKEKSYYIDHNHRYNDDPTGKNDKGEFLISAKISADGIVKLSKKATYHDEKGYRAYKAASFSGDEGFEITNIKISTKTGSYWASLIPTKVTPTQFKWNADECHSIGDIIKQMNSQLHFNFQKKLEKMTPLEFADYIANLVINNGGGDWDFKVNYKGESDDVNLKPAPVLNRFMRALDGDSNPTNSKDWHFQAISDKTPMAVSSLGHMAGKIDFSSFMSMLNAHLDVLPDPLDPVFALMGNFPNDAVNVFPDFLELFLNMGQAFHDSPVAQKWAADQDATTQAKFADIKNEIIRTVLQSGK